MDSIKASSRPSRIGQCCPRRGPSGPVVSLCVKDAHWRIMMDISRTDGVDMVMLFSRRGDGV